MPFIMFLTWLIEFVVYLPPLNNGGVISFLCFSVFEGLVVPHQIGLLSWLINTDTFRSTVGLPVQFFRMGTAVVVTYCFIRLLMIFNQLGRLLGKLCIMWYIMPMLRLPA